MLRVASDILKIKDVLAFPPQAYSGSVPDETTRGSASLRRDMLRMFRLNPSVSRIITWRYAALADWAMSLICDQARISGVDPARPDVEHFIRVRRETDDSRSIRRDRLAWDFPTGFHRA